MVHRFWKRHDVWARNKVVTSEWCWFVCWASSTDLLVVQYFLCMVQIIPQWLACPVFESATRLKMNRTGTVCGVVLALSEMPATPSPLFLCLCPPPPCPLVCPWNQDGSIWSMAALVFVFVSPALTVPVNSIIVLALIWPVWLTGCLEPMICTLLPRKKACTCLNFFFFFWGGVASKQHLQVYAKKKFHILKEFPGYEWILKLLPWRKNHTSTS